MLVSYDPNDASFELDDHYIGFIVKALTKEIGHRAARYAVKQIGLASGASVRT